MIKVTDTNTKNDGFGEKEVIIKDSNGNTIRVNISRTDFSNFATAEVSFNGKLIASKNFNK